MQERITAWASGEETNPAIVTASHQWQPPTKPPLRVEHHYWAIDYTETTGATYRVNKATRGWTTRLPGQFHLYSPQTIYWENGQGAPQGVESYSIMFRGGSQLGLDYLLAEGHYAAITDPSGRLKSLLEQVTEITAHKGDAGFPGVQVVLWQIAGLLRDCRRTGARQYTIEEESAGKHEPGLVELVDRYLQQHLAEKVTVEDLSRE